MSTVAANTLRPDFYREHTSRVDALAGAGVAPPDEWSQLRQRFSAFIKPADPTPMAGRLTDAIISGSTDADLPALRAAANAERVGLEAAGQVNNQVRKAVLAELQRIFRPVAVENYAHVGEQFNSWAGKFAETAQQTDVQAEGAQVVDLSDKQRRAWLDAEQYAHRLTTLTPVLVAAAELAGAHIGDDTGRLALTVDPGELHRRRVWEAWSDTGRRCSHWAPLLALGATIRAWPADRLGELEPYRQARPMRQEFHATSKYGEFTTVTVDPEDPGYKEHEPAPKPRRRVRMLTR